MTTESAMAQSIPHIGYEQLMFHISAPFLSLATPDRVIRVTLVDNRQALRYSS